MHVYSCKALYAYKPALFLQASPTRDLARGHAPGGGPRPLARAPTRFTSVEQASEEGVEEGVKAWALALLLALLLLHTRFFLSRGASFSAQNFVVARCTNVRIYSRLFNFYV